MTALYIILGVLLFLFLVLMIRVQFFFTITDEPTLTLKVLFYKKKLLPPPPKHVKKKTKKPEKKPKKEEKPDDSGEKEPEKKQLFLSRVMEKKGLSGLVSLLTEVARIAGGLLKGLFSHIVIHRLNVGISLNSGDAASTAVTYGKLCSVVYPAVNIIVAATVCKSWNVSIEPVFDSEKETEVYADVHAHLRLIFAVWEALKAGVKLLWIRIRIRL